MEFSGMDLQWETTGFTQKKKHFLLAVLGIILLRRGPNKTRCARLHHLITPWPTFMSQKKSIGFPAQFAAF